MPRRRNVAADIQGGPIAHFTRKGRTSRSAGSWGLAVPTNIRGEKAGVGGAGVGSTDTTTTATAKKKDSVVLENGRGVSGPGVQARGGGDL